MERGRIRSDRLVRPSVLQAIKSPTVVWNALASLGLCVSASWPHSLDHLQRVQWPLWAEFTAAESINGLALVLGRWPYVWSIGTILLMLALTVWRPRDPAPWLLGFPLGFASLLVVAMGAILFSDPQQSRRAMLIAGLAVPLMMAVGLRMYWLSRTGALIAAAAWAQSALAILAVFWLRWNWLPSVEQLASGGWMSIASSLAMMSACWVWPTRARHDFSNRRRSPEAFQFSIGQAVLVVTAFAIGLTYWRYLSA